MKYIGFCFFLLTTLSLSGFAQGKLLVIGGGSEKSTENSWNHDAYKWAIDQSVNKKVAIISFGGADNWLPDYFKNECGAVTATNFNISDLTTADAQSTYDDLMTYDVIFLKGGDQYNYYSIYKGTKTQQAIEDKYDEGGVICGTSAGLAVLSGVVFHAKNGSAYSDECLLNPLHNNIQLADDFFPFFPGYIFDSHFTIRSRFGRLIAFMANWKFTNNESIIGIGVDEMTALSIDENNFGTAYGIGTVNIYKAFSENTFSQNNSKLLADSIQLIQLLQDCTIDFNNLEVNGFSKMRNPVIKQEKGNYTIFASGSDELAKNIDLLNELIMVTSASDRILVLTDSDVTIGNTYKSKLEELGALDVDIYRISLDVADSDALYDKIEKAKKIVLVNNTYSNVMSFIKSGKTGEYFYRKIRSNNMITAFIGDNSRLAGHTVVEEYLTPDAAYYGELTFNRGLDLLKSMVIIPNTYLSSDYYENTAASVPYAMVQDTLAHGIWLNKDNYIKYAPNSESETFIYPEGDSPVMVLKSEGTATGFSVQTAYGYSSDNSPNFAGFENMTLSLIDESMPYKVGNEVEITTSTKPPLYEELNLSINTTKNQIEINWENKNYQANVYNLSGSLVYSELCYQQGIVSTHIFNSGVYILGIQSGSEQYTQKILITK